MIFSDLYKSPRSPLSKLRHSHHQPPLSLQSPDFDANLVSKDKAKQKEAVRRYLSEKVRNDWEFIWPPPPVVPTTPVASDESRPAAPNAGVDAPAKAGGEDEEEQDLGQGQKQQRDLRAEAKAEAEVDAASPQTVSGPRSDNEDAIEDSGAEPDSETESVYSTVSEDPLHYRSRTEWTSDVSDDDMPGAPPSPFRFDSPESIGTAVQASESARRAKRRRDTRSEMEWNEGLACFNARRDAWTGARTVRVKPKPASPTSPVSPRRPLWRFHSHSNSKSDSSAPAAPTTPTQSTNCAGGVAATSSPLSPVTSNSRHSQQSGPDTATPLTSDGDSHRSSHSSSPQPQSVPPPPPPPPPPPRQHYPVDTLVPIPAPLLPPANPMRASISPAIYLSLYDKVVTHALQPSCPINLVDMIRSCVAGWKRDGEWPPRPSEVSAAAAAAHARAQAAGGGSVVVVRRRKKEERRETLGSTATT